MQDGKLISFEGPDGAGKTTVLEKIYPKLQERGYDVLLTREPGGVSIAERIRDVILDVNHTAMDGKTELLLYMASRRQHYVEKILPALHSGKMVLIDRFIDSSIAYQGAGRGLDKDMITTLNHFVTDRKIPDLTLYFDVNPDIGLARISKNSHREVNRLDLENRDMHQRVRKGYLDLVEHEKGRMVTIDASRPLEEVVSEAFQIILSYISEND